MQKSPFLFSPLLRYRIWGGNRIPSWKGCAVDVPVGESWEVCGLTGDSSVISNGEYAGQSLASVIEKYPVEILGHSVVERYGCKLPLLAKFIDAKADLSIQVHPNDDMALREHGSLGKTEMWYVVDAVPDACLYAGFRREITPEEYKAKVADGSITDVLARHNVKTGDVFYIPAGRVHAVCSGVLIAEIQQSSDITYRIFDYNRKDKDGKERELHTELAAQALDYQVEKEYRTEYSQNSQKANHCVDSPFFSVRVVDAESPFHRNLLKYDSFVISMCVKGSCEIRTRQGGEPVVLKEGFSCLIPASVADYDIVPIGGAVRLLDAYIDNMDRSLLGMASRFLHLSYK